MMIATEQIVEGERFRKAYGNIESLANSIRKHGIIQPLVVDRAFRLIAGGRRLTAARAIALAEVPVVFRDEVDDLTLRELELEENIQREDLTWQERVRLTAEIDRLKRLKYGEQGAGRPAAGAADGWSMRDTAQALDQDLSLVSREIAVARCLAVMPELNEETSWTNALKRVDRTIDTLERELAVRAAKRAALFSADEYALDSIWLGDSVALLDKIPSGSVDLILIDPPYGTDAQGSIPKKVEMHFDDSPEGAMQTLSLIMPALRRVAKPNAHVYIFFGIKMWVETFAIVRDLAGWQPDPIPLVWVKNLEGLVDFNRRFSHAWEPIMFCGSDERMLSRKSRNVFTVDAPQQRANIAEKPVPLLEELISLSTREGELVLDCFSGSGATCVAAKNLKRHFIGIEQNRDQWNASVLRLAGVPDEPAPTQETDQLELG